MTRSPRHAVPPAISSAFAEERQEQATHAPPAWWHLGAASVAVPLIMGSYLFFHGTRAVIRAVAARVPALQAILPEESELKS